MGCRTSFVAALVIGMDDSRQMYKKSKTGRLMKVLKNGYKFFLILYGKHEVYTSNLFYLCKVEILEFVYELSFSTLRVSHHHN